MMHGTASGSSHRRQPGWWVIAAMAWAGAMLLVFRGPILSGFALGFGDRGDSIIEISLLEHWRAVLRGAAMWNQPIYFHPYTDTLGYNDGYLLSGLIYSAWRSAFDPFVSDTLTAMSWKTIGYATTLWLVRGVLGWRWGMAILIAVLLTLSNNLFLQAGHAQIQTLALLPVVMALSVLTVRRSTAGARTAPLLAALTALVLAAWLITTFYFAWFTGYFALALGASWLILTGRWRLRELATLVRQHWQALVAFGGTLVIAAIPFIVVYAPKRLETGGHGFMISYLVQPTDLTNVGEQNLLWGWLYRGLRAVVEAVAVPGGRLERALIGGEHESGFPLVLFALACAAGWRLIRRREDTSFLRAFAVAIAVSWLLTLRIWQVSPWLLVHFLVPASSGVRVVLRYQLFLVLPVLLLVGAAYHERFSTLWRQRPWLAAGLVALLIAEQVNLASPARMSRAAQLAALNAVPPPPAGCAAFYTVATRRGEPMFIDAHMTARYPHNVDAMFLAQRWRVPTVNGFSTFNPPTWNFAEPTAPDYDARVATYARRHGITGLCRLDMRRPSPWSKP